jgi:glycosyltransferase involved in cell wall biosynthesis
MPDPTSPSPPRSPSDPAPGAQALHQRILHSVEQRRAGGRYEPGLEDRLDAHGRTMVAVRAGPGGLRPQFATTGRRARLRHLRARLANRRPGRPARVGGGPGAGRALRILFVVQRYGEEVAGGAELCCRQFATRLAARGHHVEVATSRAQSALDWADTYPSGTTELDGVTVHRFDGTGTRDNEAFEAKTVEVLWSGTLVPPAEQEQWRSAQGPELPGLVPWLTRGAVGFDVAVHFSYLYTPTWAGLPVTSARVPTVLHATAHDEPAFWLPVFDDLFPLPTRFVWFTEEERDLLVRRGAPHRGAVIGIGVDLDSPGDGGRFRTRFALGDRPYLVFVGRVEAGKGSEELVQFFVAYKERNPGPLALVLVGPAEDRRSHPDLVYTGFVDDGTRSDALAGAVALAQPSFFESFSMVLTEAWAQGRPVVAQGRTDVLVGQVRRSGGGVWYSGFAEFEAAVDLLVSSPELADTLGAAGRRFVEREYRWETVLRRYEGLLRETVGSRPAGRPG